METRVRQWLADTRDRVKAEGALKGSAKGLFYVFAGGWLTATSRRPLGVNIFQQDWDLLLVLDACRVDVMEDVADQYDFVQNVSSVRSVGSTSSEWMAKTFDERNGAEIESTAYVTANAFSRRLFEYREYPPWDDFTPLKPPVAAPDWNVVEADRFEQLDEVWRYGQDEELRIVPPEVMTDRAIDISRTSDPNRLVVHYMQPHAPFIGSPEIPGKGILEMLEDHSKAEVWAGYRANLERVLGSVGVLLENVDADTVVITADHGEAFGEWGSYGHTVGFLHPSVKRVPWVETTATDTGEYEPPTHERPTETHDSEDVLRDLGYL